MNYKLEFRPLANLEVSEAFDWYESRKAGLGHEFLNELEAFCFRLLDNPLTHSFFDEPVRQGVLNRFPYCIVYEVFENLVVVYSVFMAKQDPAKKRTK